MKHFIFALTALTMLSCSQEAPRNVAELCDDDPSTSYAMPASRPCRVVFDGFDTPMRSYRVYSSGEVPAADPAGWVLSGSHDGRKWVELDRREGCVFCSRFQEITGRIAEPSNYTAYKIEFLPREEADTVAVGDVRFYERDREEAWSGFVYPAVDFEVLDPQTEGAAIYATLVQDPGAYVRYHTRKVAEILFYSAADTMNTVGKIDYTLKDYAGVSAKSGNPAETAIVYSTQHIEKSARESPTSSSRKGLEAIQPTGSFGPASRVLPTPCAPRPGCSTLRRSANRAGIGSTAIRRPDFSCSG